MIGTAVEFQDLMDRIRGKFGLRNKFRCKIRDEDTSGGGDMITLGDQDDLDMAIAAAKTEAKRERADMGKLEVGFSLSPSTPRLYPNVLQIWAQEVS